MANQPVDNAVTCETEALYVYCIVPGSEEVTLGPVGLDMCQVRTVPGPGISVVVHECPALPYQSTDRAIVEEWVGAHHRVVEAAWKRFGSALPMSFDMIVRGRDGAPACENVVQWMQEKRDAFTRRLDQLAGKAEYGVQISWEPKVIAADVLRNDLDLQQMQRQIETKPAGLAYVARTGLDKAVKERMEARAATYFRDFYDRIRDCVEDLRVERPGKTDDGTQILLNVSCLITKGDHARLGRVLDQIAEMRGIRVRFTGPWPPYSFVGAG